MKQDVVYTAIEKTDRIHFPHLLIAFLLLILSLPFQAISADSLNINVYRIATEDVTIRGKSASFPDEILSFINITAPDGKPISGLADSASWQSIGDFAPIGYPVENIWRIASETIEKPGGGETVVDLLELQSKPSFREVTEKSLPIVGVNTMLLLDESWSITHSDIDSLVYFIREGAKLFIDNMRAEDSTGIIAFSTPASRIHRMTNNIDSLDEFIGKRSQGTLTIELNH